MANDYSIKNYIDENTVDKMVNRLLPIYEHLPSEEDEINNDLADMQEIIRDTLYSSEFKDMWDDVRYSIDDYINATDTLTPERIHKECNPTDNIINRLNNAAVAPLDFSNDDYWKQITNDLNPTPAQTAELFGTAVEVEGFRIIEECVNKYAVERQQELQQMKETMNKPRSVFRVSEKLIEDARTNPDYKQGGDNKNPQEDIGRIAVTLPDVGGKGFQGKVARLYLSKDNITSLGDGFAHVDITKGASFKADLYATQKSSWKPAAYLEKVVESRLGKKSIISSIHDEPTTPSLNEGERVKVDASTIDAPDPESEIHL